MAGGGGGGGGEDLNRKQKLKIASSHDSVFASDHSNPFIGSSGIVSFGAVAGVKRSRNSFFQSFDQEDNFDQYFDEYLNQSEKKRRLSMDQLQFLEKSFESENKLEPERKIQLAKELGLQPRQIAIWFQNRRARWKTKQLETDYETLHANYMNMKNNYDNLLKENEKLKAEVLHLKQNFQTSDSTSKEATYIISEDDEPKVTSPNEDKGLAKSDARNENIPSEGIRTFGMESGDSSSKSYEPDQSDLSKNREDSLSQGLLQSDFSFPKTGDAYYHPPTYSCYYGYLVEDQPFSFWSY